jgi:excisionase family DNA binding protein
MTMKDEWLTVEQVLDELAVPRSTFYKWRQLGLGPRTVQLPNRAVRIRRSALDEWLKSLEDGAA